LKRRSWTQPAGRHFSDRRKQLTDNNKGVTWLSERPLIGRCLSFAWPTLDPRARAFYLVRAGERFRICSLHRAIVPIRSFSFRPPFTPSSRELRINVRHWICALQYNM
jgi:hypothetical protein